MAGIADVAARAGVSKATASRALTGTGYVSEATRARVRAAAAELDYVPSTSAVSLATGRTQNVGVVMPYVNRWFFAEVLEGIQEALLAQGLDLTLYDAKPGTEGAHAHLQRLPRPQAVRRPDRGRAGTRGPRARAADADRPAHRQRRRHRRARQRRSPWTTTTRRGAPRSICSGSVTPRIAFLGGGTGPHWAYVDQQRLAGYRTRDGRGRARRSVLARALRRERSGRIRRPPSTCSAIPVAARRRSSPCATKSRSGRSSRRGGSASRCPARSASSASTITSTPRCSRSRPSDRCRASRARGRGDAPAPRSPTPGARRRRCTCMRD